MSGESSDLGTEIGRNVKFSVETRHEGGAPEADRGGDAVMDRNEIDELVSLESITAKDIRRIWGQDRGSKYRRYDRLMVHFAECCRKREPISWNVKKLDLMGKRLQDGVSIERLREVGDLSGKRLGDDGFVYLIGLLEDGYFNDIRDLRICIEACSVSRTSMERFLNLFQTGRLKDLLILHFHFSFPRHALLDVEEIRHESIVQIFWENFAEVVLSSSRLEELTVSHGRVSKNRSIRRTKSGVRAAEVLAAQFVSGHLSTLRVLNLRGLGIGCEGMTSLAQAFRSGHKSELESLKLESNQIGKAGVMSLVEALRSGHLGSLRILDLSDNNLGYEGLVPLATSFQSGHASDIESLKLGKTKIGEAGAKFLAKVLGSGHLGSLRILDLSHNNLRDEGFVSLANSLQSDHASKLETLGLAWNATGDRGIKSLAAALECGKCPKLLSLDLKGNKFDDEGQVALAKAFKSGHLRALETVNLEAKIGFRFEESDVGLLAIAGALETGSLPCLKNIHLGESDLWPSLGFDKLPDVVLDGLENSYQRNPYLVADICKDSSFGVKSIMTRRMISRRRSNKERVKRLKVLKNEADEPGQHGKVFFCGDPRVGKTTLRLTLTADTSDTVDTATMRPTWLKKVYDLFNSKSLPEEQELRGIEVTTEPEPTRGIEVTNVQSGGVTIAYWDLAGEHDYEVLHSAFLPDLNFANGQATFFVIVCNAQSFESGKGQLEYWMRFISSNSMKGIEADRRRRVFVVLNCFHGHRIPDDDVQRWKVFVANCEKGFRMYLNVYKDPFIVNVKSRSEVEHLKSTILEEAEELLQRRKMPRICHLIQEEGRKWAKNHEHYPVLTWDEFRIDVGKGLLEEERLEAAAEYLHEAGHIILFRKVTSSSASEGEVLTTQGSLVIVDPEWFCKQVVGNLLLPEDIPNRAGDVLDFEQEKEGEISILTLTKEEIKVPRDKVDQVMTILSRIGICYQLEDRPKKMFVPALIDKEDVPGWSANWESGIDGGAWVMGFSLRVKNLEATLIPIIVLRKLQVNIASEESIGKSEDCAYLARKYSISFKFEGMHVLIEYAAQKQDRIDILVKQLRENLSRREQINVAQEFVSRVANTVKDCSCGVELDKRIIQPWSVAEGWKKIQDRNINMSADKMIDKVKKRGQLKMMEWTVEGQPVREDDVLSDNDLSSFLDTISRNLKLTKEAVNCLNSSNTMNFDEGEGTLPTSKASNLNRKDPELYLYLEERLEGLQETQSRTLAAVEGLRKDVKGNIKEILKRQSLLNLEIQNIERFSVEDKKISVPRFAYVTNKGKGKRKWWIKLTKGVAEPLVLRLLCEASYETGNFHEVTDQEGIDVKSIEGWQKTLWPTLAWTLKVACFATTIAGNIILPGLGILLGADTELSKIVNNVTTFSCVSSELSKNLSEELDAFLLKQSLLDNSDAKVNKGSSSSSWVPGTEQQLKRRGAREALCKVLDNDENKRKVGLNRVWLESRDGGGEKHVVWICDKCMENYGPERAHEV